MLSDEQLIDTFEDHFLAQYEPADRAHLLAGLRAVEAAVRADQIKRDIDLVLGAALNLDRPGPRSQIAAAIRAQLPQTGDTDE